ncbi:MAG: NADH-quinone oxidoreductase subunit N, partial [Candidatus Binataceae bacterium]
PSEPAGPSKNSGGVDLAGTQTMMMPYGMIPLHFAWLPIIPLIVVAIGAIVVLMAGVHVRDDESEGLGWLAIVFLAIAFLFALGLIGKHGIAFDGALAIDGFAAFFELVILISAAVTILMSLEYAVEAGFSGAEYYALILFATLGMMLMATGDDLIVIFLGLEMMSVAVYVLAGFMRRNLRSNEAALKYFVMGAFSTGFLLYGIALIYGATGTIKLGPVKAALTHPVASSPLLLSGIGLLLIGFGFKVAAVPFHMWTPDVYEGSPTPITGFMAVGIKLGAFAGFLRIFMVHLTPVSMHWSWVLWIVAALTMSAGNVLAIVQSNIKRMLAYSAIAQAGYVLVGMTVVRAQAGGAILYFLLGYAFTTLGAFAVVVALDRAGEGGDRIRDYRGLALRHPALAALMALFLLSFTGVPPLAGFMGKFYVFAAALNAGFIGLVIIAVINSVVSAYYYIYVIVQMYTQEGGIEVVRMSRRPALMAALAVAIIGTIVIGIYPAPYMAAAAHAFNSALGAAPVHTALAIR